MTRFDEYCARRRQEHGDRFDPSTLAVEFISYFNSGERIKVLTSYGETITGTVSATTGWRPSFMLMRRSNAMGSSDLLSGRDTVVAVKCGREYRELSPTR